MSLCYLHFMTHRNSFSLLIIHNNVRSVCCQPNKFSLDYLRLLLKPLKTYQSSDSHSVKLGLTFHKYQNKRDVKRSRFFKFKSAHVRSRDRFIISNRFNAGSHCVRDTKKTKSRVYNKYRYNMSIRIVIKTLLISIEIATSSYSV